MPLYEYACESCGEDFERIVRLSQSDEPQVCPSCGALRAQRRKGRFGVRILNSSSNSSGGSCGNSGFG